MPDEAALVKMHAALARAVAAFKGEANAMVFLVARVDDKLATVLELGIGGWGHQPESLPFFLRAVADMVETQNYTTERDH